MAGILQNAFLGMVSKGAADEHQLRRSLTFSDGLNALDSPGKDFLLIVLAFCP